VLLLAQPRHHQFQLVGGPRQVQGAERHLDATNLVVRPERVAIPQLHREALEFGRVNEELELLVPHRVEGSALHGGALLGALGEIEPAVWGENVSGAGSAGQIAWPARKKHTTELHNTR
jgi:hypothetical protein